MKKLYLLFTVVLLVLFLSSCGLRIPSKVPEKANIKYTKSLEFPVTTFNFKVSDLVDTLESNIPQGFELLRTDPIALRLATGVSYSPGEILSSLENEIRNSLDTFSEGFEFRLDTSEFLNNIPSGSIDLPTLPNSEEEYDAGISEISVNDITLVENREVVISGNSEIDITDITYPFEAANFSSVVIQLSGIDTTDLELKVDGITKPLNQNTSLYIQNNSVVKLINNSNSIKNGNITLKLINPKLNYFRNLDLNQVTTNGKVSISIPDKHITIVNENWKIKLGGMVTGSINIPGFVGNIKQSYSLKSGNVSLGSTTSNTTNFSISLTETYFTVSDGITLEGNIELSGTVSADLRIAQPKVKFKPNLLLKAIKDYEFTVDVPRPQGINSIQFSSDSGYMVVNFTGLTLINAQTTFGSNSYNGNQVRLLFKDVSLPASATVKMEADITSNAISYNVTLPNDQTIKIASASVDPSQLGNVSVDLNYPIPDAIKEVVNSLYADVIVDLDYNIKGINGLKMDFTSNFFDNTSQTFNNTNGATQTYQLTKAKTINFSTFSEFELGISLDQSSNITISNVDLREGAWIKFKAKVEKFEIDDVNIKAQNFTYTDFPEIDIDTLIPDDMAFLREFEYDIEGKVQLRTLNTTVPATITLNVIYNSTSTEIVVRKGEEVDISDVIKDILNSGGTVRFSANIETGSGVLNIDSILDFVVDV
ncbi:MAG: hypothetical protein ACK4R7_04855, partial [Fervidobacterium sp.]